ncbi:uncharacterized protein LOC121389135 [Gigantopelta aegis]|uniref:uncharacterized protein LOC121389135 n=1 Tax=Gigantopelta aegis TaxID=1735272 RepID=UPI001B8882C8|nr:uncharacterized protein LOC121389135 [Gigantopelta aegis]
MCGGSMKNSVYSTGKAAAAALPSCGPKDTGVEINGDCFYLGDSEVFFLEGERQCVGLGGHLATIDSEDTQSKLETYLRPFRADAWIGLSDVLNEGTFQWMDGSSLGAYTNLRSKLSTSDFVFLQATRKFQWQTAWMTNLKRPLCQLTGTAPIITKCGTNDYGNMIGTSQDCYAVMPGPSNFRDSQYACWTRNGHMALITATNKDEIIKHINLFGYSGVRDYWVQGSDPSVYTELKYYELYKEGTSSSGAPNGAVCILEDVSASTPCSSGYRYDSGSFKWVDGEPTDDANGVFWKDGQGVGNIANGKCAKLSSRRLYWINMPCSGQNAALVCKAPAAA